MILKNKTISIGISAFNEEKNIGQLIASILCSENLNLVKEIIVVSDGSSDNTLKVISRIKSKKLKIFSGAKRKGKANRLNTIIELFKGDVLMLLDADCILDKKAIGRILQSFGKKDNVAVVGGKPQPVKGKGWLEKALYIRESLVANIVPKINNGANIYSSQGRILALEKKFAKNLLISDTIGIDSFIYLSCMQNKMNYLYENSAIAYFKLPSTLEDHLKQSLRFKQSKIAMTNYFGKGILREYIIPTNLLLKQYLLELIKSPFYTLLLVSIFVYGMYKAKKSPNFFPHSSLWSVSESTKNRVKLSTKLLIW